MICAWSPLERKLGIHASPTCVMAYGDKAGAAGYLVGEENRGLEYMFTMMNNARLSIGVQGLSIAESAYQAARDYAADAGPGPPARRHQSRHAHHRPSRCAAHADDHPGQARRRAGAGLFHRRRAGSRQAADRRAASARKASGWSIC